jgi:hypothetical protein
LSTALPWIGCEAAQQDSDILTAEKFLSFAHALHASRHHAAWLKTAKSGAAA